MNPRSRNELWAGRTSDLIYVQRRPEDYGNHGSRGKRLSGRDAGLRHVRAPALEVRPAIECHDDIPVRDERKWHLDRPGRQPHDLRWRRHDERIRRIPQNANPVEQLELGLGRCKLDVRQLLPPCDTPGGRHGDHVRVRRGQLLRRDVLAVVACDARRSRFVARRFAP